MGGSDDHGASTRAGSAVGTPTTAIHADTLSEKGLIAGIRSGRVYIKVRGPEAPDVRFAAPDLQAQMGDTVQLTAARVRVEFVLEVLRGKGQRVEVIRNGQVIPGAVPAVVESGEAALRFTVQVSKGDWVRINLRDDTGVGGDCQPDLFPLTPASVPDDDLHGVLLHVIDAEPVSAVGQKRAVVVGADELLQRVLDQRGALS